MNNKQKFLDLLNELDTNSCKWMDFKFFLGTEAQDQYIKNCFEPGSKDKYNPVLMDLDGKFSIHPPTVITDKTTAELNGEAVRIFEIPCFVRDDFYLDESCIHDLDDEESSLLYNSLSDDDKFYCDDLMEFFDSSSSLAFESKYREVFPDKFKELFKEYAMERFYWNIEDGLFDQIEYAKQLLQNDLDNEFKNIGDMPF